MDKLKILLIVFMSFFSCQVFFAATQRENDIASRMYSGNPALGNIHTYVFVCRMGVNDPVSLYQKHVMDCCHCSSCNSKAGGLGMGFITTQGPLLGIDESDTNNIIWSAFAKFGPKDDSGDLCGLLPTGCASPSDALYSFQYVFGENYCKKQRDGSFISLSYGNKPDIMRESYQMGKMFPVLEESSLRDFILRGMSIRRVDFFEGQHDQTQTLRVLKTLRTALYRWTLRPQSITDVLKLISRVGGFKREIPKYEKVGFNCATFVVQVLSKITNDFDDSDFSCDLSTKQMVFGGLAAGTAFLFGGCRVGIVTLIVEGALYAKKVKEDNMPDDIVSKILKSYKKRLDRQGVKSYNQFRVIAHRRYFWIRDVNLMNYRDGQNFFCMTVKEASDSSVEKTDQAAEKFLVNQFK